MSRVYTPQSERSITQQGVSFTQTATAFDSYARTTAITRTSTLGYSRADSTAYYEPHGPLGAWSGGHPDPRRHGGLEHQLNPNTALPSSWYRFGKLHGTYLFNGDGTLSGVTDGLNHATTFSTWVRGLPQNIGYADGSGISAVVNNLGLLTSVTNEVGTTWSFATTRWGVWRAKHRPAATTRPRCRSCRCPARSTASRPIIGARPITTGNAVTVNVFDARWRKR